MGTKKDHGKLSYKDNQEDISFAELDLCDKNQPMMHDPFEVRVRFTALLRGLNASQTSALKAAQLALKHKDMHEDLHSCILEQLIEVSQVWTQLWRAIGLFPFPKCCCTNMSKGQK